MQSEKKKLAQKTRTTSTGFAYRPPKDGTVDRFFEAPQPTEEMIRKRGEMASLFRLTLNTVCYIAFQVVV